MGCWGYGLHKAISASGCFRHEIVNENPGIIHCQAQQVLTILSGFESRRLHFRILSFFVRPR